MQTHYDTIYLSPHLDDATLSCGGQIYEQTSQGQAVLVVTVMAGDPSGGVSDYAQSLQERWELPADAGAGRRAEDLAACRILGVDALHWNIPDCIYRTDPETGDPLYLSDDDIFADVHPAESTLVDAVADLLGTLPACERVVAPLTVGHHVDHLIVRAAAEEACDSRLFYYEDYPYAQERDKLAQAVAAEPNALEPMVVAVGDDALAAKIEAILAYRSQLSTFWNDRQDLEAQILGYARQIGGERLWRPEPAQRQTRGCRR